MGFSWDFLFQGFVTAFSLQNLLWALVGCFIGTLVGVLPGIGPASGIAILLPLTTVLPPTSSTSPGRLPPFRLA
jgi:putative tricarboxylic transport membrane protein